MPSTPQSIFNSELWMSCTERRFHVREVTLELNISSGVQASLIKVQMLIYILNLKNFNYIYSEFTRLFLKSAQDSPIHVFLPTRYLNSEHPLLQSILHTSPLSFSNVKSLNPNSVDVLELFLCKVSWRPRVAVAQQVTGLPWRSECNRKHYHYLNTVYLKI